MNYESRIDQSIAVSSSIERLKIQESVVESRSNDFRGLASDNAVKDIPFQYTTCSKGKFTRNQKVVYDEKPKKMTPISTTENGIAQSSASPIKDISFQYKRNRTKVTKKQKEHKHVTTSSSKDWNHDNGIISESPVLSYVHDSSTDNVLLQHDVAQSETHNVCGIDSSPSINQLVSDDVSECNEHEMPTITSVAKLRRVLSLPIIEDNEESISFDIWNRDDDDHAGLVSLSSSIINHELTAVRHDRMHHKSNEKMPSTTMATSTLDDSNSMDPSSGSFHCDITDIIDINNDALTAKVTNENKHSANQETVVETYNSRNNGNETENDYVLYDEDDPIRMYKSSSFDEPSLEDLMSIIDADFPECFDNNIERNSATPPITVSPPRAKNSNDISKMFPNSSLDFSKDEKRASSMASKQSTAKDFFNNNLFNGRSDDNVHHRKSNRHRKMSETLEIIDENCTPNRPHPALEYPMLYFMLRRWQWLFEAIKIPYAHRWRMSYPLQRNVPLGTKLLKLGYYATWGELLILIPFFVGIIMCTLYTLVYPSVSITGIIARNGLISTLIFAQKNSLVTLLLGMPCDRGVYYHKLSGRVAGIASALHAAAFFVDPKFHHLHKDDFFSGAFTGQVNFSGSVMIIIVVAICITAMQRVRRRLYEFFYYLHIIFSMGLIVGALFHTGLVVPIAAALTWGVDLFIRSIVMARTRYPRTATLKMISDTVIEVSFPKTKAFCYNPGQFVYLAIPEISWLQWHPFSVSSSPKQRVVTFHVRKAGNWTKALFDLCQKKTEVSILLEGPYGNLSVDLFTDRKYKNVMLISGGIGITPMQSICEQLLYEKVKRRRELHHLKFVWIERDPELMAESSFIQRTSSIGSLGSLAAHDDLDFTEAIHEHINLEHGNALNLAEEVDEVDAKSHPTTADNTCRSNIIKYPDLEVAQGVVDFDESLNLFECSLDDSSKRSRYIEGESYSEDIENIISIVSPTMTTDSRTSTRSKKVVRPCKQGPIDFDESLVQFEDELDDDTKRSWILNGEACVSVIGQLLSVVAPSRTTDDELEAMYQSTELVVNEIDDAASHSMNNDQGQDSGMLYECDVKEMKPKRRNSFVLEDETSYAENDQCWLTETYKVHDDVTAGAKVYQDLLQIVDMQVYLTRNQPGLEQIPYAKIGRPDIKKIFSEMKVTAIEAGDKYVAVCVCAPKAVTDKCREACIRFSDQNVQFDFHTESVFS